MNAPYVTPCPLPTEHERELLTVLIEECAEVAQRATKALRFGLKHAYQGDFRNAAERMAMEIGDLIEVIDRLAQQKIIDVDHVANGVKNKRLQLAKFMQTKPGKA
jgi:NTP pyrophosphatase (non-canonical NTP hydrolase)